MLEKYLNSDQYLVTISMDDLDLAITHIVNSVVDFFCYEFEGEEDESVTVYVILFPEKWEIKFKTVPGTTNPEWTFFTKVRFQDETEELMDKAELLVQSAYKKINDWFKKGVDNE